MDGTMSESKTNLRELKVRAQSLKPAIRLGKAGLTPEFLAVFEDTLQRGQLIKLRFEALKEERKTVSRQLAEQTGSTLVQQTGHTAVFYRAKRVEEPPVE
jgi:RNA-binding protein